MSAERNQRPTALIFQNLALFPLMTIWENISFGLEVRGVDKATRRKAFADAFLLLNRRISLRANLSFDKLSRLSLQTELDRIGQA